MDYEVIDRICSGKMIRGNRILYEKIHNFAVVIFIILGLSACLSEPFSRHCVKAILALVLLHCAMKPVVLHRLKNIKKLLLGIFIFVFVMFLSCIYGGDFIEEISRYRFLMHYNALLLPAAVLVLDSELNARKIMLAAFAGLCITDIYIIYQFLHGVYRPESFLKGTIMLGTMLYIILLPAMAIFTINANNSKYQRIYSGICTIVSLLAFVYLNTRGAWLALFPVLIFIILYYVQTWKKKIAIISCMCLLLGAGIMASPTFSSRVQSISNSDGKQQSVNERFLMWHSALQMGMDHPLMGVGMGNYETQYQQVYISPLAKEPEQKHAHNNFMQFFAENGIVGLFAYLALLTAFFTWSWKRRKNIYAMIMFTATLDLALYSLTDYTFAGFGAMRLYWLVMGICAAGVCSKNIEDE